MNTGAVNELLGKYICSVLPARRSPILFQAEGSDKNFSKGRPFSPDQRIKEGVETKVNDRPHTVEDERKYPRKSESMKS